MDSTGLGACCLNYSSFGELDVIVIIDNSGSVDNNEFIQMKNSTERIIDNVIDLGGRVAVVHYGGAFGDEIYIESDFTDDIDLAKSFERRLRSNDVFPDALRVIDDALSGTANPRIISPQVTLNRQPSGNLGVFLFTDATRYTVGVSQLVDEPGIGPGIFDFVADFKTKYRAKFEVVQTTLTEVPAAAAIASRGGSYFGVVELYAGDPEEPGSTPRRLTASSFELTTEEINNIIFQLDSDQWRSGHYD